MMLMITVLKWANSNQLDLDWEGLGDACNICTADFYPDQADTDGDTVDDVADNCLDVFNSDQADTDGDGVGDTCDNAPSEEICDAAIDNDRDGLIDGNDPYCMWYQ